MENNESIDYLGLKRTITLDLDYSTSQFQKMFQERIAPQSFFTSFQNHNKKNYHGTLDNREFEIKERRGFTGSKKVIPVIKGELRESNFKTKLKISVGFDFRTIIPFLLPFIILPLFFQFQNTTQPPFVFVFFLILPVIYYFQMRHAVKKTTENIESEVLSWV